MSKSFWLRLQDKLLSSKAKKKNEKVILSIAIIGYLIHLLLIFLVDFDFIRLNSKLFGDPIAAIYTPFSFILVYEVYLLVFFLPKSISFYIGKQYEIITLIVIRRIFKDLANLELTADWFTIKNDLQFTYDVLTSIFLFYLIYLFYFIIKRSGTRALVKDKSNPKDNIHTFIMLKRTIATILVPVLFLLASYTFYDWANSLVSDYQTGTAIFNDINTIFFDEFFTILIIVDVLLLLASFYYSDKFHKIIRNSGFVISTILLKISFTVEGMVNNALILGAVLFGLFMLYIHDKYETNLNTARD